MPALRHRLIVSAAMAAVSVLATSAPAATLAKGGYDLASPDGKAVIHVTQTNGSAPVYSVDFAGLQILAPSQLGLRLRDGDIGPGIKISHATRTVGRDTYSLNGPVSHVTAAYRQLTLDAATPSGRVLTLVFRAYNDGVAFRYVVPQAKGEKAIDVMGETTTYQFTGDDTCFALTLPDYKNSHEGDFLPTTASALNGQNFIDNPLVCKTGKASFAIAESDVDHYAGAYLKGTGNGVAVNLSPRPNGNGEAVHYDFSAGPLTSPWRVVMLGKTAGDLTQSTLIYTLASPSRLKDSSWVKPGKTAWDWWNGYAAPHVANPGVNTETIKAFIDFSHSFNMPYMLVDDGWYKGSTGKGEFHDGDDITVTKPEIDMPALVAYAKSRNVDLMLWAHWTALDHQMDAAFAQYQKWGIKGIKVDFMDRNDQDMVAFYHRVLSTAAKYHVLVDLHGAYPPNGLARTYPNFITQEGVLGAEYNKWSDRVTATHNVNLAYTRLLLGPADYTPGGFRNLSPQDFTVQKRNVKPFTQTTRGQALGLFVVMQSPLLMVSDSPDAYINDDGSLTPGADFVKGVPSTWDETRFVQGDIGQYIAIARRKGTSWTIGILNTEQGRAVSLPLGFLGKGKYSAKIYADGSGPSDLTTSTRSVTASDKLDMTLAPSGGGAVVLTPVP